MIEIKIDNILDTKLRIYIYVIYTVWANYTKKG